MRYFFDTEFIEDGRTIDLISIGIVADDGREFYAENSDCDLARANDWVKEHVIPHLIGKPAQMRHSEIRDAILAFIGKDPQIGKEPEIWAYYADYDWVVFCQLFGCMVDLPQGWPMYCRDLKQAADDLLIGKEQLLPHTGTVHNALDDARWAKAAWHDLMERGHP